MIQQGSKASDRPLIQSNANQRNIVQPFTLVENADEAPLTQSVPNSPKSAVTHALHRKFRQPNQAVVQATTQSSGRATTAQSSGHKGPWRDSNNDLFSSNSSSQQRQQQRPKKVHKRYFSRAEVNLPPASNRPGLEENVVQISQRDTLYARNDDDDDDEAEEEEERELYQQQNQVDDSLSFQDMRDLNQNEFFYEKQQQRPHADSEFVQTDDTKKPRFFQRPSTQKSHHHHHHYNNQQNYHSQATTPQTARYSDHNIDLAWRGGNRQRENQTSVSPQTEKALTTRLHQEWLPTAPSVNSSLTTKIANASKNLQNRIRGLPNNKTWTLQGHNVGGGGSSSNQASGTSPASLNSPAFHLNNLVNVRAPNFQALSSPILQNTYRNKHQQKTQQSLLNKPILNGVLDDGKAYSKTEHLPASQGFSIWRSLQSQGGSQIYWNAIQKAKTSEIFHSQPEEQAIHSRVNKLTGSEREATLQYANSNNVILTSQHEKLQQRQQNNNKLLIRRQQQVQQRILARAQASGKDQLKQHNSKSARTIFLQAPQEEAVLKLFNIVMEDRTIKLRGSMSYRREGENLLHATFLTNEGLRRHFALNIDIEDVVNELKNLQLYHLLEEILQKFALATSQLQRIDIEQGTIIIPHAHRFDLQIVQSASSQKQSQPDRHSIYVCTYYQIDEKSGKLVPEQLAIQDELTNTQSLNEPIYFKHSEENTKQQYKQLKQQQLQQLSQGQNYSGGGGSSHHHHKHNHQSKKQQQQNKMDATESNDDEEYLRNLESEGFNFAAVTQQHYTIESDESDVEILYRANGDGDYQSQRLISSQENRTRAPAGIVEHKASREKRFRGNSARRGGAAARNKFSKQREVSTLSSGTDLSSLSDLDISLKPIITMAANQKSLLDQLKQAVILRDLEPLIFRREEPSAQHHTVPSNRYINNTIEDHMRTSIQKNQEAHAPQSPPKQSSQMIAQNEEKSTTKISDQDQQSILVMQNAANNNTFAAVIEGVVETEKTIKFEPQSDDQIFKDTVPIQQVPQPVVAHIAPAQQDSLHSQMNQTFIGESDSQESSPTSPRKMILDEREIGKRFSIVNSLNNNFNKQHQQQPTITWTPEPPEIVISEFNEQNFNLDNYNSCYADEYHKLYGIQPNKVIQSELVSLASEQAEIMPPKKSLPPKKKSFMQNDKIMQIMTSSVSRIVVKENAFSN